MESKITIFSGQFWRTSRPAAVAALGLVLFAVLTRTALAERLPQPADALVRLVPADAAVVVSVEGLRDRASAFLKSPLAAELQQLPAVREWFASERFLQFKSARAQIETLLDVNLTELRDELFGDAVVISLHLPPVAVPAAGQARGILLVKARDPALLNRVIRIVNATQLESGELERVVERQRTGAAYFVREFPAAADRPAEFYAAFGDGTFAASNSEILLESVIDRKIHEDGVTSAIKAGTKIDPGLGELPRFRAVRDQLSEPALARLYVEPRQFERFLASSPPSSKPDDVQLMAMLVRYLAAVDFAGLALTWNERAIAIHSVETLNPSLLDEWLRHWAGDTRPLDSELTRVPRTALALASGHFDGIAVLSALAQLVPAADQIKLANMQTALTGLFLGQDLRTGILPHVGPSVIAYFDAPPKAEELGVAAATTLPAGGWPFPLVMVVSLAGDQSQANSPSPSAAVDNALRTILAVTALDDKRAKGRSRLTSRAIAGTTVTTLDPPINFAYAVDHARRRLVVSTSSGAVVRYLENCGDPQAGERFRQLRKGEFADAVTYACIDFDAVHRLAGRHRAGLLQVLAARQNRPATEVDRDLAQVLALARLFRAGFFTSRLNADATAVHRSMGLVLRDQNTR